MFQQWKKRKIDHLTGTLWPSSQLHIAVLLKLTIYLPRTLFPLCSVNNMVKGDVLTTGCDFWAPQQQWLLPHNCSLSTTFERSGRQKSFPTSGKKSETHWRLKLKTLTAWKLICQSVWTWLNCHSNWIYQWSMQFRLNSMQSTKKQMNNVNNWGKAQDNKINHLNGSVYDAKTAIDSIIQYSRKDCLEISRISLLPLDSPANLTRTGPAYWCNCRQARYFDRPLIV